MKIEEYNKLGFDEASKREAFFRKCSEHLDHAREKHPFFANGVLDDCKQGNVLDEVVTLEMAKYYKRKIAKSPVLEHVLLSEIYEFLAESHKGDMERALEEACDIVAVLMRFIFGDIQKKEPTE